MADDVDREKFQIVYSGEQVDRVGLPLTQYAESLEAWGRIFDLLAQSVIAGRFRVDAIEESVVLSTFRFQTATQGSIVSWILWALGTDAGTGLATNLSYDILKTSFFKLLRHIRPLVNIKRENNSREDVLADLRRAAYECGFDDVNDEELNIFADMFEDELGRATRIVMAPAEAIELKRGDESVVKIERRDAIAFRARSANPIAATQVENHLVIFNDVDNRNGWGRFRFLDETRNFDSRIQTCHILDPIVTAARNPYTRALHEKAPVEVTMQRSASKSGRTSIWNVFSILSDDGLAAGQMFP